MRGGVISGNIHTSDTSTPISYDPGRWTDLAIGVSGVTQGSGAPNIYAGGKFRQSPIVLGQSAAPVSHTGNTTETTLATIPVPAGSMGPNGKLRITTFWSFTASANNKTPRIKFGAWAFTSVPTAANQTSTRLYTEIGNRGATNSQVGMPANYPGWGNSAGTLVTGTLNTLNPLDITITGQLAAGTETITLEAYLVELIPG